MNKRHTHNAYGKNTKETLTFKKWTAYYIAKYTIISQT